MFVPKIWGGSGRMRWGQRTLHVMFVPKIRGRPGAGGAEAPPSEVMLMRKAGGAQAVDMFVFTES